MASNDERVIKAAQQYRQFWAEHPVVSLGLGFVPVLGQALGAVDALAAYGDPEASKLERGMSTAGILPMGKAFKHGRDFIIGKKGIVNLRKQRAAVENAAGAGDPEALATKAAGTEPGSSIVNKELVNGEYLAEIQDDLSQLRNLDRIKAVRAVDGTAIEGGVGKLEDFLPEAGELYKAYPWMRDVPVVTRPKKGGGYGASFGSKSADPKTFQLNIDVPASDAVGLTQEHLASTILHELQHSMQRFEELPSKMLGANSRSAGWVPYMTNPGEIMARVTEQRKHWTPEQRKALSFRDHWKGEFNRLSEGHTMGRGSFDRMEKMDNPDEAIAQYQRYQMGVDKNFMETLDAPKWGAANADPKKGQFVRTMSPDEFGTVAPGAGAKQKDYLGRETPNPYITKMYKGQEIDSPSLTAEWDAGLKEWYVQDADGLARAIAAKKMYGPDAGMPVVFNTRGIKPGAITDEMRSAPVKFQPTFMRKP